VVNGDNKMKMIRAILRPDRVEEVVDSLSEAGHVALTKMDVIGRGKQKGIQLDNIYYDELPKVMLLLVTPSEKIDEIVEIINETAFTGNFGDGKIFISPVEEAYTVRTRTKGL
jgi:nitrogen regulatory protein PII 1